MKSALNQWMIACVFLGSILTGCSTSEHGSNVGSGGSGGGGQGGSTAALGGACSDIQRNLGFPISYPCMNSADCPPSLWSEVSVDDCVVPLQVQPVDLPKVTVQVNCSPINSTSSQAVSACGSWTYNADSNSVEFSGQVCETLHSMGSARIDLLYGGSHVAIDDASAATPGCYAMTVHFATGDAGPDGG